jgi:hypothetical protein
MLFRQRLQRLSERPLYLWLALWLVIALLYLPAWKAGFQQDFQGWLQLYRDSTFAQMLNREGIPVHSFYQLTQLQLYIITKLFGTHFILWFLLFTALHALNGATLYRLARCVMEDFAVANAPWIALSGTLLVLLNPSMTEVVVWKAAYHYLIAVQAILRMLLWARHYILHKQARWIWYSLMLLAALVFTLELWYTIPVLVALMALAYRRAGLITKDHFRVSLFRLTLPQFGIFIAYLLAYRFVYHDWFAHTAFSSPGDDSVFLVASRLWGYEWHLLGFGRFFPHRIRQWFYWRTGYLEGGCIAIAAVLILAEWAWRSFPEWNGNMRAMALFAAWSVIALLPILHYLPADLFVIANDRYLYLTAFFQWMFVAMLLEYVFRRSGRLRQIIYGCVLLLCISLTAFLVREWRRSAKIFWAVQDKFVWKDAPVVLILNMPSLYNGAGIIRGADTSELPDHLRVFNKGIVRGRVYDVSSYNMLHPWDGAHVIVQDSTHLHVILNQWGSWWQLFGRGATDRSTPLFDLHLIDEGHHYLLTLKKNLPGMVILYQQGLEWRVVDMSKIGQEQW